MLLTMRFGVAKVKRFGDPTGVIAVMKKLFLERHPDFHFAASYGNPSCDLMINGTLDRPSRIPCDRVFIHLDHFLMCWGSDMTKSIAYARISFSDPEMWDRLDKCLSGTRKDS
jgi:hypothetical protein